MVSRYYDFCLFVYSNLKMKNFSRNLFFLGGLLLLKQLRHQWIEIKNEAKYLDFNNITNINLFQHIAYHVQQIDYGCLEKYELPPHCRKKQHRQRSCFHSLQRKQEDCPNSQQIQSSVSFLKRLQNAYLQFSQRSHLLI